MTMMNPQDVVVVPSATDPLRQNEFRHWPDYKVVGTGGTRAFIRATVTEPVKTGTPLRKREDGLYERAADSDATLVAATYANTGHYTQAYRSLTVDVYKNPRERGKTGFYEGDRVSVASFDAYGKPEFVRDPHGRWFALSETIVVMDASK